MNGSFWKDFRVSHDAIELYIKQTQCTTQKQKKNTHLVAVTLDPAVLGEPEPLTKSLVSTEPVLCGVLTLSLVPD